MSIPKPRTFKNVNCKHKGKLNRAQFKVAIAITNITSKKVIDRTALFFVNGLSVSEIVIFEKCHKGTLNRDIERVNTAIGLIEIYNEASN